MILFAPLRRMFVIIWRTNPNWIVAKFFLTIAIELIPIAQLVIAQRIVDQIIQLIINNTGSWEPIFNNILLEGGLFIVVIVFGRIDGMRNDAYLEELRLKFIESILRKTASLDVATFEDPNFYKQYQLIERGLWWRPQSFYEALFEVIAALTTLAASISLFLLLPPWIVLVMLAASLPAFWLQTAYGRAIYRVDEELSEQSNRAQYYSWALTHRAKKYDLKIFGLELEFVRRFSTAISTYITRYLAVAHQFIPRHILAAILAVGARTAVFIWLARATIERVLSIGQFTLFGNLIGRLGMGINGALGGMARVTNQLPYLQALHRFFESTPKITEATHPRSLPIKNTVTIEFDHVWFRYQAERDWVLRDLSFTIHPGKHIALVGGNGEGKTTIVKLLARFYDPSKGRILVNGIDLREYRTSDIHKYIGIIFQDFAQFQATVGENISFGGWSQKTAANDIHRAARQAGAAGFIQKLPEAYDTMAGTRFAGGTELSGGQWQKIALSRVFFRNARLLILDEPTAALDAIAEENFYRQFLKLRKEISAILISHRFSTVRMADEILILANGRIIEHGSHDELLKLNGRYAKLFALQAKRYLKT